MRNIAVAALTESTKARLAERATRQGIALKDIERTDAASNALNRSIDVNEVADVIPFLYSALSRAINGDDVVVPSAVPGPIHY
jgi:enoyl-[acyl-carrier-protein] reductase (NADH)